MVSPFNIVGIDHIQVAAPPGCETDARRFYGELLGLDEIPKPQALQSAGGCWFQCGAAQLHVGVEAPFKPAKKAHPALAVVSAHALHDRLKRADVAVSDSLEVIDGRHRFFAADLFGNRIEFTEPTSADSNRLAGSGTGGVEYGE